MSNDSWTIAGLTISNLLCAVLVPSLVATQGKLVLKTSSLDALISKNYQFDLDNYPGCAEGQVMVNSACIDEPTEKTTCGLVPGNADLSDAARFSFLEGSRGFFNKAGAWGRKRRSATVESDYPWSVYFGDNTCSGTIISDRWVLSNANCHSTHIVSPLKFTTILGNVNEVLKVHVPNDESRGFANWAGRFGRKRRSADSNHHLSLHHSKETIDFGTNEIVPACVNRPSMSLYTPHNVVVSGFFNQTLKTDIAHILDSTDGSLTVTPSVSDIGSDRAAFNLAGRWSSGSRGVGFMNGGFSWGRKRRSTASDDFCMMDASERMINFAGRWGRKRRSANSTVCFGNEGDAMMFRYPSDQFILGGMLAKEENNNELKYINVLDYAHWIYETSKVWSNVATQSADKFSSSSWYDQSLTGDHLEMGLADLSRSVMSLSKALPALNIINQNGITELMNVLKSAGDVASVSGLTESTVSDFNIDDKPICGMNYDEDRKMNLAGRWSSSGSRSFNFWNTAGGFGRKRRSTEESCFGTPALGKFLELLDSEDNGDDSDRKMNLAGRWSSSGSRSFNFWNTAGGFGRK